MLLWKQITLSFKDLQLVQRFSGFMRNQSKERSSEVMQGCTPSPGSTIVVVPSMGPGPGQGGGEVARLLGTVIFAKVLVMLWCRWEDLLPFQAAETLEYKLVVTVS